MFLKKLVRLSNVQKIIGISNGQIDALIAQHKFVRQVNASRLSRWNVDSILVWGDLCLPECNAGFKHNI